MGEDIQTLLIEKARGNPLFAEQLLISLLESGRIAIDHDRYYLHRGSGDEKTLAIPESLEAVSFGWISFIGRCYID